MKKVPKILILIVAGFVIITLTAAVTGYSYLFPAVVYNFPEIDDYLIFENRTIKRSPNPQTWPVSKEFNNTPISKNLRQTLEELESVAFLIIQNDSIQYEEYWEPYNKNSYSNSFSMAKTYVSVLTGIALKEGKIKSLEQPVADFIDEFKSDDRKNIKIKDLLTMSSGLSWEESYWNPFSVTTRGYYGDNLRETCLSLTSIEKPGKKFEYRSGDTQVLSFVLEKATGMSLSEYFEKKLWQVTGAEQDALWSLDKENGKEKAYCCLNSNARDFARLGKLYLNKGNWNGKQLVDTSYVNSSLTPVSLLNKETGKPVNFYGYSWWLIPDYRGNNIFYARGILGQYVIVIPEKNTIVVRLGHQRGDKTGEHHKETLEMIDEVLTYY